MKLQNIVHNMKDLFPAWLLFNGLHYANSALEAVKCSRYPKKFSYAFPLFTVMVGFFVINWHSD